MRSHLSVLHLIALAIGVLCQEIFPYAHVLKALFHFLFYIPFSVSGFLLRSLILFGLIFMQREGNK